MIFVKNVYCKRMKNDTRLQKIKQLYQKTLKSFERIKNVHVLPLENNSQSPESAE
jgi:hypothetical protein